VTSVYPSPEVGDIVWCRFPEHEAIKPGPKPRPALVLSVMDNADPVRVRLVYGTSQKITPVGKGQMVIGKEQKKAFALSGLSYPTKFDFNKVIVVPYNDLWFDLAPKGQGLVAATPKLGSLHVSLMTDVFRAVKEAGLVKK
jgi:hypothetical protein